MAKIVITIDTEENEMSATINGKAIESPSEVSAYKMDKDVYVSVVSVEGVDDSTRKMIRYCSAECKEAVEAASAGLSVDKSTIPGLVIMPEMTKAQRDIKSYFGNILSVS